jgi:biopolymer transport protein ExbB/TolQ
VAIPLTVFHSFMQGRAKAMVQTLEEQAAGLIARMAERRA